MGQLDQLLRCTLGGSAFQLADYSYKEDPRVEGGVRQGSTITVEGRGWIQADTQSDLATALSAAAGSCRISGQDFEIIENNISTLKVLAATSVNGGPHVAFEIQEQSDDAALVKPFKFTVTADTLGGLVLSTGGYTTETSTAADDLRVVTRTGQYTGVFAGSFFLNSILPVFISQYPYPQWIVVHDFTVDLSGTQLEYRITATEMLNPLPVGAAVRDGEGTFRQERDDQMRLVSTYDFDLLIVGDPQPILDQLRQLAGDATEIVRETAEITLYRETRLRAGYS
jgi:hypothetical protein